MKIINRKEENGGIMSIMDSVKYTFGSENINYDEFVRLLLQRSRRRPSTVIYTYASYPSKNVEKVEKKKKKDKIPFYDTLNGGKKYFKQKYKK